MNIEALTTKIPTEPGEYWIRKPGMKKILRIELKLENGKWLISGEAAFGGAFGGMMIIADYPLEDCEKGTEWMTGEEGDKYF